MSKIQEITIDDVTYRVRAPRLKEYLESKKHPPEDLIIVFLGGMILDAEGNAVGREGVEEIPLAHFDQLAVMVNTTVGAKTDPLVPPNGSLSGSPSASEEPSVN